MDSLTHLVAGALTPLAFRATPKRAALLGFGIAAGEFPDIDIIFGFSPEALLFWHRGITHALIWQPLLALAVVLPFFFWMRRHKPRPAPLSGQQAPASGRNGSFAPSFSSLMAMALFALYTHIYLDCMTTFGTRILLPFSQVRVGFASMFIVDLLLTLPALVLMIMAWKEPGQALRLHGAPAQSPYGVFLVSEKSLRLARIGLAWLLLYPLACLGVNAAATAALRPALAPNSKLSLLTEPFSPFFWKAVVDTGDGYRMSTVCLPKPGMEKDALSYNKPDRELYAKLEKQLPLFSQFNAFCSFMIQLKRPASAQISNEYGRPLTEYSFADLRYLISPHSPAYLINRTDPNFVLEARVTDQGELVAYRFLQRGKDRDRPWIPLAGAASQ